MIHPPTYEDGCFRLYQIRSDTSADFPRKVLKDLEMMIWYRELSVFDHLRYEFNKADLEVTMKIRIPLYKGIDSKYACKIDGKIHQIYNATHVKDKNGFPETELTLIRPGKEIEIDEQEGIK